MVRLDSVSMRFGGEAVFSDLDWQIPENEVVGLVGPNGAGKTTLFEIIAGRRDPQDGEVVVPSEVDVGYLPQELTEEGEDATVLEVILEGAADLVEMRDRLEAIEAEMEEASAERSVELSETYHELQAEFEGKGGYDLESSAQKIAAGLGFSADEFDRPLATFSGGWRMRAALGRLLLGRPDLLLLDEPTNHLDLDSLAWLEEFLAGYDATVVAISHDRYFLNRLADSIAELSRGELHTFTGNYDTYRRKRREWRRELAKKAKEQQKEIDRIQEFVDKFRYNASKASLVQSRLKRLEKIDPIEVPEPLTTDIEFEFPQPPRVGETVVELKDVDKAYGDNVVYDRLDYRLYRGDKVAFVGPNGAGKSTLMKMMAGVEEPDDGGVETGHRVDVGYFAQHSLDQLDPEDTVFEALEREASHETYPDIRPILGAFGFSGDAVEKQVSVLSGGEKARLALARLLLEPAGCLLFDEPTNHLDIPSVQILEKALQDFEGAVGIISHDRYFLNEVVNKVVRVESGDVSEYVGDYDAYEYRRSEEEEQARPASNDGDASGEAGETVSETVSKKERRQIRAELRRERRAETESLRDELEEIEARIEELEERQEELDAQLADPSTYDGDQDVEELNREYGEVEQELLELMERWEEKGAELEAIREEYEERARELCGEEG